MTRIWTGISLLALLALLTTSMAFASVPGATFSPSGKLIRQNSSVTALAADPFQTLESYLKSAYGMPVMKFEKSSYSDSVCGDAYFLDFEVNSFWNDIQVKTDFYVQTQTKEAQDRLFDAIQKNYPTKGLPKCLLQDQFYNLGAGIIAYKYDYDPDFTTVLVPVKTVPIPDGFACAKDDLRPLTTCWNVQDPYKD